MSALTTVFNFLYVYLRVFFNYIVGGGLDSTDFSSEQVPIVISIYECITGQNPGLSFYMEFEGEPVLMLIIGIFALGSIIGLARRLIKG